MPAEKTIFVCGATGKQGGAVVRNLIRQGFAVKALTRNKDAAKAAFLTPPNVELIQGNLDNPSTYHQHLRNTDGVFALLDFTQGISREIRQGIDLANCAKENGVNLFLYSSVVGADLHTGIPHWESKLQIENHIKQIGLSYTIIRPSSLYENFLISQVKSRLIKGKLVVPLHKSKVQQYISAEDIGRIATNIFLNPEKYKGQTINLAGEQMNGVEAAEIFSKVWNKQVRYQQLPGIIARLAMGKDLYTMFNWINKNDVLFVKDLEVVKKEFPGLMTLEEWIKKYFN
jgi:uncharacterized protein YbjT (DUF2867 family)